MISKRVEERRDGKSSALAALKYGEGLSAARDLSTGEILDKSLRTRFGNFGMVDDGVYIGLAPSEMEEMHMFAASEMETIWSLNTRVQNSKKLAHFIFSFHEDKPSEAVLLDTENSTLAALGMGNNHYVTFLHNDNGYWHLHMMISRIEKEHPYRSSTLSFDQKKRDKICREIELRYDLRRDNGMHEIDSNGNILEIPLAERRARREERREKTPVISDHAQAVEKYSGEKTFQTWCNEIRIGDRLKPAKSWKELHSTAAAYSCEVRQRGAGFVLCPIGEKGGVTLSAIGLKKIADRLGPYQSIRAGYTLEVANRYSPGPTRESGALYQRWKTSKTAFRVDKAAALNQLRNSHTAERTGLRKRQREEISVIRSSITGSARSIAVDVAKLKHAAALTALSEKHAAERREARQMLGKENPGETFREYLSKEATKGSEEALMLARQYGGAEATEVSIQRESEQFQIVAGVRGAHVQRDKPAPRWNIVHRVDRTGTITFDLGDGRKLIDSALSKQIQLNRSAALDPAAVETSLRFASAKFGNRLVLTGPAEFQKLAVETAVAKGLNLRFVDPVMDAYREKLEAERAASRFIQPTRRPTSERAAVVDSPRPALTNNVAAPSFTHLNPLDIADSIDDYLAAPHNYGISSNYLIHSSEHSARAAAERARSMHELSAGGLDDQRSDGAVLLQNDVSDDMGVRQAGHDQNLRRPGPIEKGGRGQGSSQGGIDWPAAGVKEEAYAALVREFQQGGGSVYEVKEGVPYVGLLQVSEDGLFAVQRQGRGAVVIHDLTKLDGKFASGQNAEITYRNGVGRDQLQGPERGLAGGIER